MYVSTRQHQPARTLNGCAPCALIGLAGLGCAGKQNCNACSGQQLAGLGDFASFGAGTGLAVMAGAAVFAYFVFKSNPAKIRRAKLTEARKRYNDDVRAIKAKYGRFGILQEA